MTKYISDVQTVEESGTTGIRITVSEDIGETTVRAVNTVEFDNIQTTLEKLQNEEVTTTKLEEYLKNYAKLSDLDKVKGELLVSRIQGTVSGGTNTWDYSTCNNMYNTFLRLDAQELTPSIHGFCLVVRPGGYQSSDIGKQVPVMIQQFQDGNFLRIQWQDYTCSEQTLTFNTLDGSSVTETCLVCPLRLTDTPGTKANPVRGIVSFNYRGRNVSKIWEFNNYS
jgi:hypothetical protein